MATMDIWQRHAERLRRQAQFARFDAWATAHPRKAVLVSAALAFGIFALSQLLKFLLDSLAALQ